jgi:hypothetical protein
VCGERLWGRPFIEWHCCIPFFICGKCAHTIKNGLTADLIQCAAIVELNRNYGAFTFTRELKTKVEKTAKEMREAELALLIRHNTPQGS